MTKKTYKRIQKRRIIALHENCTLSDVDAMPKAVRKAKLDEALDYQDKQAELYADAMMSDAMARAQIAAPSSPNAFLVPGDGKLH